MQIVNVFLCRGATRSVLSTGLLGKPLIVLGVMAEIAVLLLVNYTAWGNALLGTGPMAGDAWGFIVPFAMGRLVLEEARKWIARKRMFSALSPSHV